MVVSLFFRVFEQILKTGITLSLGGSIYLGYLVFQSQIDLFQIYSAGLNLTLDQWGYQLLTLHIHSIFFWPAAPVAVVVFGFILLFSRIFIYRQPSSKAPRQVQPRKVQSKPLKPAKPTKPVKVKTARPNPVLAKKAPPAPKPAKVPKQVPVKQAGQAITSEENIFTILCHVSPFLMVILIPLVVMLTKGKESSYIRHHAVEALNFQISLMFYWFITAILMIVLIGIPMAFVLGLYTLIVIVMATIKGSDGAYYRYPFILRLVR